MSFENSYCQDYISEKFFDCGFRAATVPIAYGSSKESYASIAPEDGFMHFDDFGSAEALAEKINYYLDPTNKEQYEKFFDWWKRDPVKESYRLKTIDEHEETGICGLCKTTQEWKVDKTLVKSNTIADFQTWWYGKRDGTPSTCSLG